MEANNLKDINNTNHIKEKGNGLWGYLVMLTGFIGFMIILSKLVTWLLR
jgi:hypothetical protein